MRLVFDSQLLRMRLVFDSQLLRMRLVFDSQLLRMRLVFDSQLLRMRLTSFAAICAVSPPRISAETLGTLFLLFVAGVITFFRQLTFIAELCYDTTMEVFT
jgi:hypothetical protein